MNVASNQPVVLVTGAAKRLGREIALALARAGWRVAVHYKGSQADAQATVADCAALASPAAAISGVATNSAVTSAAAINGAALTASSPVPSQAVHQAGVISHLFQADLSDEAATRALLPAVVARMGRVDAVVNSASLFAHDSAASFSYSAMQAHWQANTGAPILLAQALHTHIQTRELPAAAHTANTDEATQTLHTPGAVVNMLDQKLWNQNPDFLSYTLSKAALEAANTMLAIELAPLVRVVGVAPGLTLTSHLIDDAKFKALHRISPLGRSSTPQDVCAAVLFALTNQSITGTTLLVDGGQHLMRFERDFSMM